MVGLFLGGTPNSLRAQSELNSLSFVDSEDNKVTLPFKFISNLIIIPVLINNSDSLYFILDTGLNISILTELSMGDSLSLNYTKQVKLSGQGTIISHTTIHTAPSEFKMQVPYTMAIIKMDEGPQLTAQIIDSEPDQIKIGTKVQATFRKLG